MSSLGLSFPAVCRGILGVNAQLTLGFIAEHQLLRLVARYRIISRCDFRSLPDPFSVPRIPSTFTCHSGQTCCGSKSCLNALQRAALHRLARSAVDAKQCPLEEAAGKPAANLGLELADWLELHAPLTNVTSWQWPPAGRPSSCFGDSFISRSCPTLLGLHIRSTHTGQNFHLVRIRKFIPMQRTGIDLRRSRAEIQSRHARLVASRTLYSSEAHIRVVCAIANHTPAYSKR